MESQLWKVVYCLRPREPKTAGRLITLELTISPPTPQKPRRATRSSVVSARSVPKSQTRISKTRSNLICILLGGIGRMDVQLEFKLATREQARDLFLHFFPDATSSSTPSSSEDDLADRFSQAIPDEHLSIATIQGYLMEHRRDPREAVDKVKGWVAEAARKGN